jgi:serralysin
VLDGGQGVDTAAYAGKFASYAITATANGGWSIKDNAGTDGTDNLVNIESLAFSDRSVAMVDSRVASAMTSVLRLTAFSVGADAMTKTVAASMAGGTSYADAIIQVTKATISTSAVAALSYQFFTGKTPTAAGMDYLVAPDGANPNNLNSAYYQAFTSRTATSTSRSTWARSAKARPRSRRATPACRCSTPPVRPMPRSSEPRRPTTRSTP